MYDVALISQCPEQKHCHVILVRDVFVIFGMEVLSFRITSFCVVRVHCFFRDTSTISLPVVEHVAKAWNSQEEPMYFHKMFTKYVFLQNNPNIILFATQALGLSGGAFHSCQRITSSGLLGEHHAFGTYLNLLTLRRVL